MIVIIIPVSPMRALAPKSVQVRPSTQPPLDISGHFLAIVSGRGGWAKTMQAILSTFCFVEEEKKP
jgi:hypothetical protein